MISETNQLVWNVRTRFFPLMKGRVLTVEKVKSLVSPILLRIKKKFTVTIKKMKDNFGNIFFCKVKVFIEDIGFGSIGLVLRPFSFEFNINVDIGGQARLLLAGKPCQLKVLSEALMLNRRVL